MYQAKSRAKARHVCARIEATPTAAEKPPLPCLRTRRQCIDGMSSNRLPLGITFFRALRDGPSPPLQRVLCRELRGPSLREHDVQLSRELLPHDAWPLPRDGVQHASDVLMLSCDALLLSLTYDFLHFVSVG
jgi:hypothetical protein